MKKLLAAALLFTVIASPAFAAGKSKQPHVKYHTPKYKYKAPKKHHHTHVHHAPKSKSN